MDSSSKILAAAITGIAAGTILGLLFAPDKGSVTRKRILDTASDVSDKIKSGSGEVYNKISDLVNKVKPGAENLQQSIEE